MSESFNPSTPGASSPPSASGSQSHMAIVTGAGSFQSAAPAVSSPAASQRDHAAADSRIAELRAMFPDFEESLLVEILQSVNWNQDRAIDLLLGMSDPNFKSESRPEEHVDTQTELDEQLARMLHMEDQERHSAWVAQQMQSPLSHQSHHPNASTRPHARSPSQHPPNQEGGTMTEVQDQFTKIAETGKKTFGNLFSKVKAKIQEFESGRPAGSSPPQTNWSQPQQNHQWQSQAQYPAYQSHSQRLSRSSTPSPPIQLQGPEPATPQPAFYDPNTPPWSHTPSIAPSTPAIAQTAPKEVTGYDVTPTTQAAPTSSTSPTPKVLDPSKLGILPKRPVSLLHPQSPPDGAPNPPNAAENAAPPPGNSAAAKTERPVAQTADYDDENILDYADNPFEDHRK